MRLVDWMRNLFLCGGLAVLAGCGGGSEGLGPDSDAAPEPNPPAGQSLESAALRFSWRQAGMREQPVAGAVDFGASGATAVVEAAAPATVPLILQAVDALRGPRLDGVALMTAMHTESLLHLGGPVARYLYGDDFDPRWRGRVPRWVEYEEALGRPVYADPMDAVDPEAPDRPKVLRDAVLDGLTDLFFQRDIENRVQLAWGGALVYRFEAGRPIRALRLRGPDAARRTTFTAVPGGRIRLSADGVRWTTVWTARAEGQVQPQVVLPPELAGGSTLYLSFETPPGELQYFDHLYVALDVDGRDWARLAAFPAGQRRILFTDAAGSTHRARLAWRDGNLRVRQAPTPVGVPPMVLHLGDVTLALGRSATGVPGAPIRLEAAGRRIWQAAAGIPWQPPAAFRRVEGRARPFHEPWAGYRDAYLAQRRWRRLWSRTESVLSLDSARYAGRRDEGDATVLRWTFEDDAGRAGTLEWVLGRATVDVAGQAFVGIGLQVRAWGPALNQATHVRLAFPVDVMPGDRWLAQGFRWLTEDVADLEGTRAYPRAEWLSRHQGFVFHTGAGRTLLAYFDRPTAATLALREERARHSDVFDIPLGAGGDVRTTATLYWLVAPVGATDRWAAADAWGAVREWLAAEYARQTGIARLRPVPTVVWIQPGEAELDADLRARAADPDYPSGEQGWFDRLVRTLVPRARDAGIRNLIVQPPWDNDAVHPETPNASGHAIHELTVAPLFGGEAALGRLVEAAHRNDLWVTLWYPSALSLFSPLIPKHTDWLSWQAIGVPDDGGWGDVVGMDPRAGWNAYAVARLRALHARVPFDGLWIDSWPSLSVIDYADPLPRPVLPASLELLAAFSDLLLHDLGIEGTGLLGLSQLYGDYETSAGPPRPNEEQRRQHAALAGHEYMLLGGNAGTYLDLPMYHRALASGGMINVANLDEVEALSAQDRAWLRRVNLEHRRIVDRMDHRHLLVQDGRWRGVAWTDAETGGAVVFAFGEGLTLDLGAAGVAEDLTSGETVPFNGVFTARPWRTYTLRGVQAP